MSKWRAIAPVRNLNLLCEELVIPKYVVRHFSEEELSTLLDRDSGFWSKADFEVCKHDPWFYMEYEADPEKEWDTAAIELENFLIALSLYKTTSTILSMGHFYVKKLEGAGVSSRFRGVLIPRHIPVYILKKEECEEFIDFYKKFLGFKECEEDHTQRKRIMYALNFFSKVRRTRDLIDRLIFLSISLEALFSQEMDELKYRYSHRATILLGTDSSSRTQIFRLVREFYDKRSQVLHGNLKFKITFNDILMYNEIIRASILRYISLHLNGRRGLIRDLDELVFNDEEREKLLVDASKYFGEISEYRKDKH